MTISSLTVWGIVAVAAGAGLAAMLLRARGAGPDEDRDSRRVDEASEDSFPASDPPSFTPETGAQAVS